MATVHIIGGGVSGLAAATQLAAAHVPVKLYEATAHAGGRARSSQDAALGTLDHGLHLITGETRELFRYLYRIGTRDRIRAVPHPIPLTTAPLIDYLEFGSALLPRDGTLSTSDDNQLMEEWLPRASRTLLHTDLLELSTRAARRALWSSLRNGNRTYAPTHSLSDTFITPALDHLDYHGGSIYFSHALKSIERKDDHLSTLTFARKKVACDANDILILATPASFTQSLLPMISVPQSNHSSITLHYAVEHREPGGSFTSPLNAPADLIRFEPNRISVMIRVADNQWHSDTELLAHRIWRWLQKQYSYLQTLPPPDHAIWREKRAGHRLTPNPTIDLSNLPPRILVAGDWVMPYAPASLETAIASGHRAADEAAKLMPKFTPRAVQHPVNHYNIQ